MSDAKRFELRAVAGEVAVHRLRRRLRGRGRFLPDARARAGGGAHGMKGRLLYAVDTKSFPGKVRLRFVEFTEEFVDPDASEFKERRFPLCDANDPIAREFIATLTGAAK
jgi:hypothetical protein